MCKCGVSIFSVVIVSNLLLLVTSFNIDTYNYVQHKEQDGSMFGFSIATHREQGRNWVIVGAPTAQSEHSISVTKGGVVYKCITTNDNGCDEIVFNDERSEREKRPIDDKDFQWFGATVNSAGPNMPIVACAPRYVWFTKSREERRDPVGTCYITKNNFRDSSEYSPCRTSLFGYHRQGSCQAGFSAGISKDGRRLFVGAPGSWYWQGQTYSIDPTINFPFTPGIFGEAFGFNARAKGQVFQQSLDTRPAVMSTPEGPAQDDDSYMGYSMVVGDFNHVGTQGVAVGMPKGGEELEGRILLYTWNLTNYLNISGSQLGAYFGYALANSDIDGDKRDDLIIGAPLHTEKNTENKYEVGRVVIACQGYDGSFSKRIILDGFKSKSRFGLSLSTLGDINLDGYGDFAVGAPYDGPFERGAVYIFQGAPNGDIQKYSQVIYAEDVQKSYIGPEPVSTFGFSIAGGLDLDGNNYPDVAIGAYLSNVAYFFRARPVVNVEAYVKFLTPYRQLNLDQKDCAKPGFPNVRVTCTDIEVCMKYTGLNVPSRIELDIEHILDAKKPKEEPRMYLARGPGHSVNTTVFLDKDSEFNCVLKDKIYLEERIIDKLTELVVEVRYWLKSSKTRQYVRDPRSVLTPILDESKHTSINDSVSIYKNCGADNVCIPDLHLDVNRKIDGYVYEIGKSLEFIVEVTNHAEDAYNAKFYLHLPEGIGFKVAKRIDSPETKVACPTSFNKSIIVCDIGNPLSKVYNFKLEVEPIRDHKLLRPSYDFLMNVTSANPENASTLHDNVVELSIKVIVTAVLSTEGTSMPTNVYYNLDQYPTEAKVWDTEIGPQVIHSYTVTNKGPSDVQDVEIFIIWPHLAAHGNDLLYLLEEPHTLGDVQCERVGANYRDFKLAEQRDVWNILGRKPTYHHHNATPQVQQNKTVIIEGQAGNTVTTTETEIIYYDENKNIVHHENLVAEPNYEEYWQQISKFVNKHNGPLKVLVNTTIHVKYENGTVVSHTSNRPGIPEVPYASYDVYSNSTTLATYTDTIGNTIYEEMISEEPGSESFTKRVRSTTDRYTFPLIVRTNTTRETSYITSDGKVFHQEFFSKVGTGDTTNIETSKISTIINLVLYDASGKKLEQHAISSEPGTQLYWDKINNIVSKYTDPITIRTFKGKIITYYVNGVEVRKEEVSGATTALDTPFRSYTDTITTVNCFNIDGQVLDKKSIAGESETKEYNKIVSDMVNKYKQPITIKTNTTTVITYRGSGGKIIQTGHIYKEKTKAYHHGLDQNTKVTIKTTVTVYNSYGKIMNTETITEEPGSPAYWNELNKIVSKYKIPVTISTTTTKTTVYFVNGAEIEKEEVPINGDQGQRPFITHTDITTTVTCRDENGHQLHQSTILGDSDTKAYRNLISSLLNKHPQPITIKTNTTKVITYRTENGHILHIGYLFLEKTEHHNQNQPQTTVATTTTTVTIYDSYGSIITKETITDEPGTESYWQNINKIISQYTTPITIGTNSVKIITYFINGKEVNKEEVPIDGGNHEVSFTTHTQMSTSVTCKGQHDNNVLYSSVLPGDSNTTIYRELVNTLIGTYAQPITITTNVTKTTIYKDSIGNVVFRAKAYEVKTQNYNLNSGETTHVTFATVITVLGSNGAQLHQETITEEPETPEYWNKIDQIIAKFSQPVNLQTITTKHITYYRNGLEIKKEEKPFRPDIYDTHFTTHIDVITTITCKNDEGMQIRQVSIPEDSTTSTYNDLINTIKATYKEPITIYTNTTKKITYQSSVGQPMYTGYVYKHRVERFTPGIGEITRTTTVTVVSIYDNNGNSLTQETITEEPNSVKYWDAFNKIVSKHTVPMSIRVSTTTVTTYYINGLEVRKDEKPFTGNINQIPSSVKIESNTTIICRQMDGKTLYDTTISGDTETTTFKNLISNIINTYRQPITITTSMKKRITYLSPKGTHLKTATVDQENTQSYNQNHNEVTKTITETVIQFYDDNRNLLQREISTEEPGTPEYWEVINTIIKKYTIPITIRATTTTIIVYYVNGVEIRREPVPNTEVTNEPYTTQSDATTTVTCYASDGEVLYQTTISGNSQTSVYNDLINSFRSQYSTMPISIHTNTTKAIKYLSPNRRVVYTGYVHESRTQSYNQHQGETSRISTVSIVRIHGVGGNVLEQLTIMDAPDSPAYWEQINNVVIKYYETITIHTDTKKVITYYVNGKEVRSEQIPGAAGSLEDPVQPDIQRVTVITCYGPVGNILNQKTISSDRTSPTYHNQISVLKQQHPDYLSIHSNTTITIYYKNLNGVQLHVGRVFQEHTDHHNPQRPDTSRTIVITIVSFSDPSGVILHQDQIRDKPGSTAYWESIKNTISKYPQTALNIHTNTTKTIIYYSNGREVGQENVPETAGIYATPFSSHVDIVNVITFYGPNREVLNRQTVRGELTLAQRKERLDSFSKTSGGTFTMETNTTKTITYRSTDGTILFTDNLVGPDLTNIQNNVNTKTEIKTTFMVYGPDQRTILDQHTVTGGPGSPAYNDYIARTVARFPGSITIYTNSTKTITFFGDDANPRREVIPEPRSTIQRGGDLPNSRATTRITFYGPDGNTLHQDTIQEAPGTELLDRLNQIAKTYGGVVRGSVDQHSSGDSLEGSVKHIDTPYPGRTFENNSPHFTDFSLNHGYSGNHKQNGYYNNSSYTNQSYGNPSLLNLQEIHHPDLGSYAKRRGYVNGGIDLGVTNSGNIDQNFNTHARQRFETLNSNRETDSRNSNYNYLKDDRSHYRRHGRTKREEDSTTNDIRKLSECITSNCSIIRCTTGPLHNGSEVHIALRARINLRTLTLLSTTHTVKIQSMLLARISQFEEISGVPEKRTLYRQQAITNVMPPQPDIKPDIVPLWVVILSAVAGTLILLLLIFLLYKCGFFNRSRPSDAPERQPLNRNGHFQHGDEAL